MAHTRATGSGRVAGYGGVVLGLSRGLSPHLRVAAHPFRAGLAHHVSAIGFVVGAGALALLNLADRIPARRFFTLLALCAALSTALIPALAGGLEATLLLRFLSGFFLTGVYPTGMKIMATWTQKERGLGIGLLVGALTLVHDPLDPHACSVGRLGMGLCLSGARPVGGYRGYVDVAARAHRHTSGWWQKIKTGIKLVRWLDQKVDR